MFKKLLPYLNQQIDDEDFWEDVIYTPKKEYVLLLCGSKDKDVITEFQVTENSITVKASDHETYFHNSDSVGGRVLIFEVGQAKVIK